MYRSLTLDQYTADKLYQSQILVDWFRDFSSLDPPLGIKRFEESGHIFLISDAREDDNGPFLIINMTGENAIFENSKIMNLPNWNNQQNLRILERIITVFNANKTSDVDIPRNWHIHRENNIFSIFATNRKVGKGPRIHFDAKPRGTDNLFVFALTEEAVDFSSINKCITTYERSQSLIEDAVLSSPPQFLTMMTDTSYSLNASRKASHKEQASRNGTILN